MAAGKYYGITEGDCMEHVKDCEACKVKKVNMIHTFMFDLEVATYQAASNCSTNHSKGCVPQAGNRPNFSQY